MHRVVALIFALTIGLALPAAAAAPSPLRSFDPAAFEQAQQQGEYVVVDYFAAWCPVCRRQHKNLEDLLRLPKNSHIRGFVVDYETSKELRQKHAVEGRSTLILFKGRTEIGRVRDVFDSDGIEELLSKAAKR